MSKLPHHIVILWAAIIGLSPSVQAQSGSHHRKDDTPAFSRTVTLYSAASTAHVVTEILHHKNEGGMAISSQVSTAASGILARQIAAGAPADIFITANKGWVDWLEKSGTKFTARVDIARNHLVLTGRIHTSQPADTTAIDVMRLTQIMSGRPLAMGNPDFAPLGQYAKQALTKLQLWPLPAPGPAYANNARQTVTLAERGGLAAIVYASDAHNYDLPVLYRFGDDTHAPILYCAVMLNDRLATRAAFAQLTSAHSQEHWRDAGFKPIISAP